MKSVGEMMKSSHTLAAMLTPLSETQKHCDRHGTDYTERVYRRYTQGCPECAKEAEQQRRQAEEAALAARQAEQQRRIIEQRIGMARIPKRFAERTVAGYCVDADNRPQRYNIERIKAYAHEFSQGHSGRNLAPAGQSRGTGKTHLACAVARHVIRNCGGMARFASVSELNRTVREAKSYGSAYTESQIIAAFGGYDLLVIDEVGVQSGTDAESRALFDVFNERYQNCRPTILISNLDFNGLREAVGARIADSCERGRRRSAGL
ncbi:ATP-binding protein, partial [Kingella potus]|uniref:ATP-binding protein n=1 Tax=Kingella potus TaxID=265175 RepID=UPI000E1B69CC